jgi:type I restriction enzyme S subunit
MSWEELELKEISKYRTEKISTTEIETNYISTENMLPEKGGIIDSSYPPTSKTVASFKTNDILVSNIRPYFKKIWFADFDGGCSNDVIVFKSDENNLIPKFLYYQLSKDEFFDFMMSGANGTKMPRGNRKAIPTFKFLLPPLQTQKRIADILSAYDDLIENNLKRIKLLEQAAQNIYKEWFVYLRFPGHENAVTSEETGLPEGWEEKPLGEFTEIKKGKNITKSTIIEGNVPVVAGGLKPAYYHNVPNTINPVITVSASGANAGYINIYLEDIWASDCSYIDTNLSDSIFFIHNLLSHQQDLIFGMQRGAAQPHVYPKDLKRTEFLIPEKDLIIKFEEQVSPQYKMKRVLLGQNQKLKVARDILLPRLMNRTIKV